MMPLTRLGTVLLSTTALMGQIPTGPDLSKGTHVWTQVATGTPRARAVDVAANAGKVFIMGDIQGLGVQTMEYLGNRWESAKYFMEDGSPRTGGIAVDAMGRLWRTYWSGMPDRPFVTPGKSAVFDSGFMLHMRDVAAGPVGAWGRAYVLDLRRQDNNGGLPFHGLDSEMGATNWGPWSPAVDENRGFDRITAGEPDEAWMSDLQGNVSRMKVTSKYTTEHTAHPELPLTNDLAYGPGGLWHVKKTDRFKDTGPVLAPSPMGAVPMSHFEAWRIAVAEVGLPWVTTANRALFRLAAKGATSKAESDWGSGFTGSLKVTNAGNEPMYNWQVSFAWDRRLYSVWNARILTQKDGVITLAGESWNRTLQPGQSVVIGLDGAPGGIKSWPRSLQLRSGYPQELTAPAWQAGTYYPIGSEVTHKGKVWICKYIQDGAGIAEPGVTSPGIWSHH